MSLATYSDLSSAFLDWVDRTGDSSLTTRLPDFITNVEATLMYGNEDPQFQVYPLRVRAMETWVSGGTDTVASTATIALPSDYLAMRDIYLDIDPRYDLIYVTPYQMDSTMGETSTGQPQKYTLEGNNIRLAPTPDGVYTIQQLYYAKLAGLTSSNTTNWLMTQNPNIYLYGVLFEACFYLRDMEGMQLYFPRFRGAVNALQSQDERDRHSGGPLQARTDTGNP